MRSMHPNRQNCRKIPTKVFPFQGKGTSSSVKVLINQDPPETMLDLSIQRNGSYGSRGADLQRANSSSEPWINAFEPKSVQKLKIHFSKLKTLREWIDKATTKNDFPSVLLLYGNSGSGKQLAVKLICEEMHIGVVTYDGSSKESKKSASYVDWIKEPSAFFIDRQVSEEEDFSLRAKYSSLPLQFVETNSNKKTKTVPGLRSVSSPHETTPNTSILMAKDVEDFDGSINESTFSLLISSGLSVVFIVSGGYSREDGFALQRRIIPAMYRDRVSVELVHWPALTEKKILNHLQHIRDSKHLSSRIFPDERLQCIAEQANGDMRQATNQLYFLSISSSNNNSNIAATQSVISPSQSHRQQWQSKTAIEEIDLTNDDSNGDEDDLFLSSSPSPPMKRKKLTKHNSNQISSNYTQLAQATQKATQRLIEQQSMQRWSKDDQTAATNTAPDSTLGSFRALGRLLHTRLDSDGKADKNLEAIEKSSELEVDKLMAMLFTNGTSHIHDMLLKRGFLGDDQTTLTSLLACSKINEDISLAERWYQRRYDPAAMVERGHDDNDDIFPSAYCKSLLVRSVPVAKQDLTLDAPRDFSSTSSTSRLYKLHTARRAKQTQLNNWRMYSFTTNLNSSHQEMSILREGYAEGEVMESLPVSSSNNASMLTMQSWATDIMPIMGFAMETVTNNVSNKSKSQPTAATAAGSDDQQRYENEDLDEDQGNDEIGC